MDELDSATQPDANNDPDASLVAALIGDDDQADYDDDEGEQEEKYTVKINGTEKAVTKSELIAHYQKGEAATQKFEEAAQIRREFEEKNKVVVEHQNQLQTAINHFNGQLQRWQQEDQPDWKDLLDNNPHEYLRQQQIWGERNQQAQQAQVAQQILNREREAQQNEHLSNHLKAESAKLVELMPEWKDEKIKERDGKDLWDYLVKQGYTPEEINNLNHSKASNIKLVINAMKYDKLMEKANAAKGIKQPPAAQDIKPLPTVGGNSAVKKSPEKMTDSEFAQWRRSQISKRNRH